MVDTYFSQKIQRQVLWLVIAPPIIGPKMLEKAKTELMRPETSPNFGGGVTSGTATKTMEYVPEPPMPWRARKTMLNTLSSPHLLHSIESELTAAPFAVRIHRPKTTP